MIQYDKVDKRVVRRSLIALRKATNNVLGAVLNGVDLKTRGQYYYYHYQPHARDAAKGPNRGRRENVAVEGSHATLVS